MATTILLKSYTKTSDRVNNVLAIHVTLNVHDVVTGNDLQWNYDLNPSEIASVVASESNIITVLQQQGQAAYNSFLVQISPTPVPVVQASPHLFSINNDVVSVT